MPLRIRIEPPITLLQQGLLRASERVIQAAEAEMAQIAEAARARAALRTPGTTLHRGWQVRRERGADGLTSFVVENTDPRFSQSVELSDGRITNLGEMLEYGTRPHRITAKPGGVLAFFWPAVGRMVFVKSVEHPGTKPYGMIRSAFSLAQSQAAGLGAVVGRVIGRDIA